MAQKGQLTKADALEFVDYQKLLDGLHRDKKYNWELYCVISFCTACRISDVISIKWSDVLYKNEFLKLERKTKKTRQIKLNDSVQKRLLSLYELMGRPDMDLPVIANQRTGNPITREHINRTLKTFRGRYHLPIKNFSSHTFRKTFGRYVWEKMGRTIEAITLLNQIFKHSSIQMTIIYLGIQQEEIDQVYDMIEFN